MATEAQFAEWLGVAMAEAAAGRALPYVTRELASGQLIGSTRFHAYDLTNRRLEIGHTFIGVAWQGTRCNPEAKLLQLAYAFDELGMMRVELKTNAANLRSRRAMRAIGATEEGVLRRWRVGPDGEPRDVAWFSVIDSEWPRVREHLQQRLQHPRGRNTAAESSSNPIAETFTAQHALGRLAAAPNTKFIELLRRPRLSLEVYRPQPIDLQQPHDRDEAYVVMSGRASLLVGRSGDPNLRRLPCATGDLLFVAAHEPHRFVEFSDDFAVWVVFAG
jgi:RimJ/RimL family protein N-acetyltransferase